MGGGLATLPFLYDIADQYPWFDRTMLIDMVAVAESTPGPIGVNTATYAGFHAGGILGGLIATFGLVLPSYLVIVMVAKFLTHFSDDPRVKAAFYGLRPIVTGMIAAAGLSVARVALLHTEALEHFAGVESLLKLLDIKAIALFAVVWFLYVKFKKHPIFYIAGSAMVGILLKM
ncbi:MAG: chromate transporter [Oscillospiraceae bacterium]